MARIVARTALGVVQHLRHLGDRDAVGARGRHFGPRLVLDRRHVKDTPVLAGVVEGGFQLDDAPFDRGGRAGAALARHPFALVVLLACDDGLGQQPLAEAGEEVVVDHIGQHGVAQAPGLHLPVDEPLHVLEARLDRHGTGLFRAMLEVIVQQGHADVVDRLVPRGRPEGREVILVQPVAG